jgi:hypothetical protein
MVFGVQLSRKTAVVIVEYKKRKKESFFFSFVRWKVLVEEDLEIRIHLVVS